MALKNPNEQIPPRTATRRFLDPNITRSGRLLRLGLALGLVVAGVMVLRPVLWLAVGFFLLATFAIFEAWRGWCLLRACGLKTRL